jgi:hypothetical protein
MTASYASEHSYAKERSRRSSTVNETSRLAPLSVGSVKFTVSVKFDVLFISVSETKSFSNSCSSWRRSGRR